jgi:peptidoglycan L-alanyl-D-glutamate endopeptidase CwlK
MDTSRDVKDLSVFMQKAAADFLVLANAALQAKNPALKCALVQTGRSPAYQNALYAQGRTKPGPVVTNARAGQSPHTVDNPATPNLDSEAFDVGIFEGKKYLTGATPAELELYKLLGPIGKQLGLRWGGDFKSIKDYPHFENPAWKT